MSVFVPFQVATPLLLCPTFQRHTRVWSANVMSVGVSVTKPAATESLL